MRILYLTSIVLLDPKSVLGSKSAFRSIGSKSKGVCLFLQETLAPRSGVFRNSRKTKENARRGYLGTVQNKCLLFTGFYLGILIKGHCEVGVVTENVR